MPLKTLEQTMDDLYWKVRAGIPVLLIESPEESRALDYLGRLVRVLNHLGGPPKRLIRWTAAGGLEIASESALSPVGRAGSWLETPGTHALVWSKRGAQPEWAESALKSIADADEKSDPQVFNSVTVFFDLHERLHPQAFEPIVRPLRLAAQFRQASSLFARSRPVESSSIEDGVRGLRSLGCGDLRNGRQSRPAAGRA